MSEREIGHLVGKMPGPTLVIIGGLHGNEPAGVEVARQAMVDLERKRIPIIGEIVALAGNVRALAEGRRFLGRDLNRMWTEERLAEARRAVSGAPRDGVDPELHETVELSDVLEAILRRARGQVSVLDLHTTSSEGTPFGVVGPTPAHRAFASHFALTSLFGLEAQLPGVLTRYLGDRGCVTFAVEGGKHDSARAREHLSAAITVGLVAASVVDERHLPEHEAANEELGRTRGDLPQLIEVYSRHAVLPEHGFTMEPGFSMIHQTRAGTLIARDRRGEIRAPTDCLVLLPLYQEGSDGFFFGRPMD